VSSRADETLHRGTERLLLWHRCVSPAGGEAETLAWRAQVGTRLEVAGGELLLQAGGTLAASFDPLDLDDVIELGLGLLHDARSEATQLEIACGLVLGELSSVAGVLAGIALDRAQLLANRAQPGELVLDEPCSDRAQDTYLFARGTLRGSIEGHVVDGQHPRKRECRHALAALHKPALPPSAHAAFEQLAQLSAAQGSPRIALRSAVPYTALERLERLIELQRQPMALRLSRTAGGLQPIGALSLALRRAERHHPETLGSARVDGLASLATGAALSRERAVAALRGVLAHAAGTGGRPWLVLERPSELYPASLAVTIDALEAAPEHVLLLLLDERGSVPSALDQRSELLELSLEPLGDRERALVAESMLGLEPGSQIGRVLARLGGDTLLGVAEATRTLVSSGDLVLDGSAFRWRAQARNAVLSIPIDALMAERVGGLGTHARRALEAVCIAPAVAPSATIEAVAELDGLSKAQLSAGLEQLAQEGWLDARGNLGPLEQAVRTAMRNGMPPSRAAELHRFVARVLQARELPAVPSFAHALLAHHLAEGGRERDAASALLDAAQAAIDSGFPRMAVRMAAVARKLDGSEDVMTRARGIVGALELSPSATSTLPPEAELSSPANEHGRDSTRRDSQNPRSMAGAAMRAATAAIAHGELDAAEGLIDTAVAAGWDRSAAQRVSSVLYLQRGQVPEAVRALKQSRVPEADARTRCREAIAAALILLQSGEGLDALRAALDGLASARRGGDGRGEHVALRMIADCFRALDSDADAERVASAAQASAESA